MSLSTPAQHFQFWPLVTFVCRNLISFSTGPILYCFWGRLNSAGIFLNYHDNEICHKRMHEQRCTHTGTYKPKAMRPPDHVIAKKVTTRLPSQSPCDRRTGAGITTAGCQEFTCHSQRFELFLHSLTPRHVPGILEYRVLILPLKFPFQDPQECFTGLCRSAAMFKYKDKQHLLTLYIALTVQSIME